MVFSNLSFPFLRGQTIRSLVLILGPLSFCELARRPQRIILPGMRTRVGLIVFLPPSPGLDLDATER